MVLKNNKNKCIFTNTSGFNNIFFKKTLLSLYIPVKNSSQFKSTYHQGI